MDIRLCLYVTVTLFLVTSVITGSSASAMHLTCPSVFTVNATNDITVKIDIVAVTAANCSFADTVSFSFTPQGTTTTTLQQCSYPPLNCNGPVADNNCGCTQNTTGYYYYTFKFPVDVSRKGGALSTSLCFVPKDPQFAETTDASCKSISFTVLTTVVVPTSDWDIHLTCPETFAIGTRAQLTCELKLNSLSKCIGPSNNPPIDFNFYNGTVSTSACTVGEVDACNYTLGSKSRGCGCVNKTATYQTFVFEFIVQNNETTSGGTWSCNRTCYFAANSNNNPLIATQKESCRKITVTGLSAGKIAGITIGVIFAIALIVIIIILILHFKCGFKGHWKEKCSCRRSKKKTEENSTSLTGTHQGSVHPASNHNQASNKLTAKSRPLPQPNK